MCVFYMLCTLNFINVLYSYVLCKIYKETSVEFSVLKSVVLFLAMVSSRDSDIINFRLFAKLNAFCVTICDEKSNIAEIKIQGKVSQYLTFV